MPIEDAEVSKEFAKAFRKRGIEEKASAWRKKLRPKGEAAGTLVFTSTKMAMTAIGILVLVFLAKARFLNRIRTGLFLTMFFSFYACLVCYELVNLFRLL